MSINVTIMIVTYDIRYLPDYHLFSVLNFQPVSLEERVKINNSIEKSYSLSPLSKGNSPDNHNFLLGEDDTLFFSQLYEKYKELCYKLFGYFHVTAENKTTCWCYRSNVEQSVSEWHNHLYTSTINGVYYYQVEKDGIFFERNGKEFHYIPQQGELLIFPNDLNHKPHKTTSKNWRYSINMEIKTEESSLTLFKKYGLS